MAHTTSAPHPDALRPRPFLEMMMKTNPRIEAIDRARRKVRDCRAALDSAIEVHELASRQLGDALEELQRLVGEKK